MASVYYTEPKLKNKNRGDLAMRLTLVLYVYTTYLFA